LTAPDGGGIFSVNIYLNLTRRQFTDDVEEATSREGGRSFFFYVRFTTAAHTDIKICCGEMNFVTVRLQKNIGKDRKSSAGADDVLDLLQTFEQFFFRYTKFHYDGLRCKALGFIRQPQISPMSGQVHHGGFVSSWRPNVVAAVAGIASWKRTTQR
jgi:hypothetical protein